MFKWLTKLFGASRSAPVEVITNGFFSSLAGVSRQNRDRKSRQKIIREEAYAGLRLTLQFEDDNRHDKNAVAVLTPAGNQIGYLNSRLAGDVRKWVASGQSVTVTVSDVTGGEPDKPTQGVNIWVEIAEPRDFAQAR